MEKGTNIKIKKDTGEIKDSHIENENEHKE